MLKGQRHKVYEFEKDVIIMPSTKNFSRFMNSVPMLLTYGVFIVIGYVAAVTMLITGNWYLCLMFFLAAFMPSRLIDFYCGTRRKHKGYIKVDSKTARELITVENAYNGLSDDDKATYKSYFEGAFYGEATPEKVRQFFDQKQASTVKPLDELLDWELKNGPA